MEPFSERVIIVAQISRVVLSGGPRTLSDGGVVELDQPAADKVKIAHRAGYEHFLPNGEVRVVDGETLPVYVWSDRTRIAE